MSPPTTGKGPQGSAKQSSVENSNASSSGRSGPNSQATRLPSLNDMMNYVHGLPTPNSAGPFGLPQSDRNCETTTFDPSDLRQHQNASRLYGAGRANISAAESRTWPPLERNNLSASTKFSVSAGKQPGSKRSLSPVSSGASTSPKTKMTGNQPTVSKGESVTKRPERIVCWR